MSDDPHLEVPDMDDTEQVVLIRIVEWTEWIPGHPDQTGSLNMHNGFTGFVSSASEKLLSANVMGTGKNLDFEEEVECDQCGGTGKQDEQFKPVEQTPPVTGGEPPDCEKCEGGGFVKQNVHYGLYAMQATLAQNVSTNVYEALQAAQNLPIMEEFERQRTRGRDKRDDLVVVEHKKPPPPPRKRRKR
jgi:hypothetical protein